VAVRIVDRRETGVVESRALAVHARALEALDDLGLAEELVAHGQQVPAFSLWDGRRRLARIDFTRLDTRFPFLLDVPQHHTEGALRGYLDRYGVRVEQATELVGMTPCAAEVSAQLRRPNGGVETVAAAYVVGCDGARSTVRQMLGIPFEGHGYPQDWLLADVALDWDRPSDELQVVFNSAGRAAVFMPMRDGRWRVILYFAGQRPAGRPPALAEVAELVAHRVPGRVVVSDPSWLASFRTARRSAPSYRHGRVFLAGDAVHIHSPAGGQGLNTGLLDAQNLAWKLAAVLDGAPDVLLDSYGAERGPAARQVLDLSHRLLRLSALTSPWQRTTRAIALPLVTHLPGFGDRAARRIAQLDVQYRTEPSRRGLRPGDRAPDAGGLRFRGEPTTLHRLLRGPHHTLLLLDGRPPAGRPAPHVRPLIVVPRGGPGIVEGVDTVTDLGGEVHRRYRRAGAAHLIRPDGHLAASGRAALDASRRRDITLRANA
jgi:2-polyprenyl-6-methoxyphenol hydroxylase-like FAD-dependent oxidoreductase